MRVIIFILVWFTGFTVWAQDQSAEKRITENGKTYILYKVQQGETLFSIGKRYNVEIQRLTEINPQLIHGLKSGEEIRIPAEGEITQEGKARSDRKPDHFLTHTILRKETLYSISRKYNVTIEEILSVNPGKSVLKKGEILRIPQWNEPHKSAVSGIKSEAPAKGSIIYHMVREGETLYAISKKYGVTVKAITEQNPEALQMKPGMRLIIPGQWEDQTLVSPEIKSFILHKIIRGETLFSISRKYGISTDHLVEINPSLEKSFKAGTILRIPQASPSVAAVKKISPKKGKQHLVSRGETLYEISRIYGVTVEDIVQHNPFLGTRVPHAGDTLLIFAGDKAVVDPETYTEKNANTPKTAGCDLLPASIRAKQTIKVAFLLPLMLKENRSLNQDLWNQPGDDYGATEVLPSDTLRNELKLSNQLQFHGNSENFLHFYEGALLAIDSLKQAGVKVELEVWDTEQKSSRVKNFVSSGVLNNADLIIGPVYPDEQKEIAGFAAKHKIPVISPLSSSDEYTRDNEYFFQVNPSREFTAEKTSEYIVSSYRNCNMVVLQTSNSGSEAENESARLRKILEREGNTDNTTIKVCNFRKDGFGSLRGMMDRERKNVLVLPTVNEAEVSVVVSNMKNLSSEFDVVVIGNNRFPQFESIDPEHYYLGNLEFLTPYWPDLNQQVTRSFIHNFRVFFRTEPNQYSIQGHDVTFFFVKSWSDYGSGFSKCISGSNIHLVQGTYRFSKLPSGGYINKGLSVVQYMPSFEIIRKKMINE